MLLPLLLGNPTHRTKKQLWRPSKAEVKDGFITHVLRPMDVQDAIAHRRDFGHTLRPWMLTPILNAAVGSPEEHYTDLNCRVRNTVER
ncbi:unnamed protein product [Plutella xylostella]|uniref:(diamondback moth) hypothetical protein n=1 Tax=Plutella xylostella TaxID=51655 RepID=A0A8S4F8V2_PLUXY|nr:unnamed protein product [Plutella xylostella]